jgi:hypothetical protein
MILTHLEQKQGLGPLLAEQPSLDGAHVSDAAMQVSSLVLR